MNKFLAFSNVEKFSLALCGILAQRDKLDSVRNLGLFVNGRMCIIIDCAVDTMGDDGDMVIKIIFAAASDLNIEHRMNFFVERSDTTEEPPVYH